MPEAPENTQPPVIAPPVAPIVALNAGMELLRQGLESDAAAADAAAKSGSKTTEFASHVLTALLGSAVCVYGMVKADRELILFGGSLTGLSGLGYTASRSLVKLGLQFAPSLANVLLKAEK